MFKKVFFFLFIIFSFPALADMFLVRSIPVDISADNATHARELAMQEAQEKAFYKMMNRLTLPEDLDNLPMLSTEDIINLVQDISVANEKTSSVRYIADVDVQFNAAAMQTFFQEYQVPYVTEPAGRCVILPVFKANTNTPPQLWSDHNPWLLTWEQVTEYSDLVPLVVPMGDLQDISVFSEDKLFHTAETDITPLLNRYQAREALIMEAVVDPVLNQVKITIQPYSPNKSAFGTMTFRVPIDATLPNVLKNAADQAVQLLEQKWREKTAVRFDNPTSLTAVVPIQNLGEWIAIRKRLDEVKLIKQYLVQAVRKDQAQIEIFFAGNLAPFLDALRREGLFLAPTGDNLWSLRDIKDVPPEEINALVVPSISKEMTTDELPPVSVNSNIAEPLPTSAQSISPIQPMNTANMMTIPSITQPESLQMLEEMHQNVPLKTGE